MSFSKVILNGSILMDVTQDTVTANTLLSGETATGADGESVVGEYVPTGAEDFVRVVEGTGTSYSSNDVTKVKANVFRNDTSIESASFPNATFIGDSAFAYANALKSINFPKAATIEGSAFAFTKKLIRAVLPLASFGGGNAKFRQSMLLTTCDYGPGVSKLNAQEFSETCNLSELVLRKTDSVVTLYGTNVFETNHMTLVMQKIGHVYVPNSLKATYQITSNWSTFYASNSDIFRSLESYTVDGTTTGALDYSKIWTAHTPAYSLSNEEFDGTKVIDTGIQLFDGGSGAFTVVFSFTGNHISTSPKTGVLFSCKDSNGVGIEWRNSGSYSDGGQKVLFNPDGISSNSPLLNNGTATQQFGFIRSDGLNAVVVNISSKTASRGELRSSGTVQTLSETLLIGGSYASGVATPTWKGTINMLKVYKACLNPNEIVDLLGLED